LSAKIIKYSFTSLLILFFLIVLVNRFLLIFDNSYDLGGIEQVFVYYILSTFNGNPLYGEINIPPFSNVQYTPIYFETMASFLKLFYDQIDAKVVYTFLRAFNVFFNLLTAIFAGLAGGVIWKLNKTHAFMLTIVSFLTFTSIHYAVRPDSLKTLYLFIYFYISIIIYVKNKSTFLNYILLTFFGVLAIFTKQDSVVIVGITFMCGLFFLKLRNWAIIGLCFTFLFTFFSLIFYLQYGEVFYENISIASKFNFSFSYFYHAIFINWIHWFILIGAFSLYLLSNKNYILVTKLYTFIFLSSFSLIIIMSLRWGAGTNYYQDSLIIFTIFFFGFVFYKIQNQNNANLYSFLFIPILFFYFDVHSGYIKIFNPKKQNTIIIQETNKISDILNTQINSKSFYLYTFEKQICNLFFEECLFPAYETNNPQYLANTINYGNNKTTPTFPSKPEIELYKNNNLFELVKDKAVYAIMSKNIDFIETYGFKRTNFNLIDSTEYYYLFKYNDNEK
jgi:hypothetical protein